MAIEYLAHVDQVKAQSYIDKYLLADLKRVDYEVACYNAMESPTPQDLEHLELIVSEFNSDRIFIAIGKHETKIQLIDKWIVARNVLQIKLEQHKSNKQHCIALTSVYVNFNSFYERNETVFPEYMDYFRAVSTFCYMLYASILNADRTNTLYDSTYSACMNRQNPYQPYLVDKEIKEIMPSTGFLSFSQAVQAIAGIVYTYQTARRTAKDGWLIYPRRIVRGVMVLVKQRAPIPRIFEYIIFLSQKAANNTLDSVYADWKTYRRDSCITRHVSWCVYECKRVCTKFQIDCHSSVSCPFYLESATKKNRCK